MYFFKLMICFGSGTKALSNMSEQFSKLNKLSHSLASKRPMELAKSIGKKSEIVDGIKPTFTVGKRELSGKKRDSSSDDDSSCSNSGSEEIIEMIPIHTERPTDYQHDKKLMDGYSPQIGIIMGVQNSEADEVGKELGTEAHGDAADGGFGVNNAHQVRKFLG